MRVRTEVCNKHGCCNLDVSLVYTQVLDGLIPRVLLQLLDCVILFLCNQKPGEEY